MPTVVRLILFSGLIIVVASCGSSGSEDNLPPDNADTSYDCSVSQGFNLEKDSQELVGFINSLSIDDTGLDIDFQVRDPEDVSGDSIRVVGVLSSIFWEGGYADPIQFSAQVSTANKASLATLMYRLESSEVSFAFTVYDYDSQEKKYFKAFHSIGMSLDGLIQRQGGQLNMLIDTDQALEVVSPKNFTFMLGVSPVESDQDIGIGVNAQDKFVKNWGMPIAG